MRDLWRGSWATRIRIASGLVLMLYVLLHFLNIGLGLIGPAAMDAFQDFRQALTRNVVGEVILYGSLLAHLGLALWRLACRGTLRMPFWEAVQTSLGLLIPLALIDHIVFTRIAHQVYEVDDRYSYLIGLIWGTNDGSLQLTLLMIVWVHGCIGLHFWLRGKGWWRNNLPTLASVGALVPAFAIVGYITEGRRVTAELADPDRSSVLYQQWNFPDAAGFTTLIGIANSIWWIVLATLLAAVVAFLMRKILMARKSVRISYVDGPNIQATRGNTLLEMSRMNGVPHTSLCGGRGRCTTCRVIVEDGGDLLHPPNATELRSLRAVKAPLNARLACQIRPIDPLTVFRVFQPDGKRSRDHASQGQERELAVLFLDIRGFTARTTGQLPYDVVFLLNRFFDVIVPAVTKASGTIDKYLGDGLLALFETKDAASSAEAGLKAVNGIGEALTAFNERLTDEGVDPIRIGLGLHIGNVVLGEIGAQGNAPRTLIGDTVNAASRLESKTKELGVELLVSGAILSAAGYQTDALDLEEFELRGVSEPLSALAVERSAGILAALGPAKTEASVAAE